MSARRAVTGRNKKSKGKSVNSHTLYDALAIGFIGLGILSLIGLTGHYTGIVGTALQYILTVLFGIVFYFTPIFFWTVGILLIAGSKRFALSHVLIGSSIVFLSVLSLAHHPKVGDLWFSDEVIRSGGGYLGASIRFLLDAAFGDAVVTILVIAIVIGAILIIDMPLIELFEKLLSVGKTGKDLAVNGAKSIGSAGVKAVEKVTSNNRVIQTESDDLHEKQIRVMEVLKRSETRSEPEKPAETFDEPVLSEPQPAPEGGYVLPQISLLQEPPPPPKRLHNEMAGKIDVIERTLEEFGIGSNVKEIAAGPSFTRYEIELAPGIKVSRIVSLADNLAMGLKAISVRVEAPIPGKSAIGIEVPNDNPQVVTFREVIDRPEFMNNPNRLIMALGKDVTGETKYADLYKMPHLLIGGTTNSGKSVGLCSIIASLLYRNTPRQVKLVLVDPKRVELTLFDGIPHLMSPIIKHAKQVPGVLRALIKEMDRRYDLFNRNSVRNIDGFNAKAAEEDKLPYIVLVVDEMADLMLQAAAEIETAICRLAQLARATGIHLVLATQRPSVDFITGAIKANISSRIAFAVASQIDSRTILDASGAERLIGKGDMLFLPIDASKPTRIQGCWLSDQEIQSIVDHWKDQESPQFTLKPIAESTDTNDSGEDDDEEEDELYEKAIRLVVMNGQASTSKLQRSFRIGYGRAARLLDMMERRGIVGPMDGPRPRDILITRAELEAMLGSGYDDSND